MIHHCSGLSVNLADGHVIPMLSGCSQFILLYLNENEWFFKVNILNSQVNVNHDGLFISLIADLEQPLFIVLECNVLLIEILYLQPWQKGT